jgi:hypothetical protein
MQVQIVIGRNVKLVTLLHLDQVWTISLRAQCLHSVPVFILGRSSLATVDGFGNTHFFAVECYPDIDSTICDIKLEYSVLVVYYQLLPCM